MPTGVPITPDELQHILDLFNDSRKKGRTLMDSYRAVGAIIGKPPVMVAKLVQRMRPTTDLARMYFRAKAYKMAKKVVAKANVSEIVDVLSRPNIGVLDAVKKVEGGNGGFFLTVNADSCGAVKVGVLQPTTQEPMQLDSGIEVEYGENDEGNGDAPIEGDASPRGPAPEARTETVIEKVRRQLAERRQQSQGARE